MIIRDKGRNSKEKLMESGGGVKEIYPNKIKRHSTKPYVWGECLDILQFTFRCI
jgi:hypothetical protein